MSFNYVPKSIALKRTTLQHISCNLGLPLILLLGFPHPLHAYTDPGSGAMLYQVLAAALLGVGFYVRKVVKVFRSFCGKGRD